MKKKEIIDKVFIKHLKGRLDCLDKNYMVHSKMIEESFNLIENTKVSVNKIIDNEGMNLIINELSKSFSSVSASSRSVAGKRNEIKHISKGKTALKSKSKNSGNVLDKSIEKNKSATRKSTLTNGTTNSLMLKSKTIKNLQATKINIKTTPVTKNEGLLSNDKFKKTFNRNPSRITRYTSDVSPLNKRPDKRININGLTPENSRSKFIVNTPIISKRLRTEDNITSRSRSKGAKLSMNENKNELNDITSNSVKSFNSRSNYTPPNTSHKYNVKTKLNMNGGFKSLNEIDNDFSVSKIIAEEQVLDDTLINNKEDQTNLIASNENEDNKLNENSDSNILTPIIIENNLIIKLEYEEILDDKWEIFISKYFNITDLNKIMMINKKFGKYAISGFISDLENIKSNIENKIQYINKNFFSDNPNFSDVLTFSKGTNKAIELLNDNLYNKLFTENNVPNNDILIVYMLYFQIINHKITKYFENKNLLWKEVCNYFLNESKGKAGNLIVNSIKNPDISNQNMAKIYRLLENNSNKISPNYFSKICGTTGLFVFFVKDFLDYMGLLGDKKTPISKTIKTYNSILKAINSNLERLKTASNKIYN